MATQHNVFIRKFGNMAVIITVTDWEDFKDLEKHTKHDSPDLLLSGVTSKNIYSSMNPSMIISTRGEVKDITDETQGVGLNAIILGSSNAGPIWAYRKIEGLTAITEMISCKIEP